MASFGDLSEFMEVLVLGILSELLGARGENRTRTSLAQLRILSPVCLPVPPPGRVGLEEWYLAWTGGAFQALKKEYC